MSGISSVLNVAKGALMAQQQSMAVAGHNIANVNTLGYSRQAVLLESSSSFSMARIKIGMGVQVNSVVQYVDQFIERTIRQKVSFLNEYESKAHVLSYMETIFNETSGQGLTQVINEFWDAWQDLANNPGRIPERTALLEKAEILSRRFNSMRDDLDQSKQNMNLNLGKSIGTLNGVTKKIAELNEKIVLAESSKTPANDLRDQRANLVQKVSELVGTVYLEDDDGSYSVFTTDGTLLVNKNQSWELSQSGNSVYWNNIPSDISKKLSGGEIGAWLDFRDEVIPQYIANLDELAGTIIFEVNDLHYSGFALNDAVGQKTFFVSNTGDNYVAHTPGASFSGAARYIALSTDVKGIPANIAVAGISGGAPGDNENALKILSLQTDASIQIRKWTYKDRGETITNSLQTATIDDYYRTFTGEIGILGREFIQNQEFQQAMMDHLTELRDSVSGVNLDEEMTQLIQIQRAHDAAAKLVAIADEMLQSILQMR
ncbi:MAG: flagellar hook-associated protein FlgK [Deltaproteobacteria bacterium]|nr:flagellar hook-associated protein FlgK [Deltaproteobacteria bacterium]